MQLVRPLAAALAALLAPAAPAVAATLDVPCAVPDLIAALETVETNGEPANTINLAARCRYELTAVEVFDEPSPTEPNVVFTGTGYNGLPLLIRAQTLTINGNDAVIARSSAQGTPSFRLLQIGSRALEPAAGPLSVTLRDLTLGNGDNVVHPAAALIPQYGGGLTFMGDANDSLVLERVRFIDNDGFIGGGLAASRWFTATTTSVTIRNSTFNGNTASLSGGGLHLEGVTAVVENTLVEANRTNDAGAVSDVSNDAGGGGMVCFVCPDLQLRDSQIRGNRVRGAGGGGLSLAGSSGRLERVRIEENEAQRFDAASSQANLGGDGGGLVVIASQSRRPVVTVVDSLIVGNTAANRGGGVAIAGETDAQPNATTLRIANSTISGNSATSSAGGIAIGGGEVSLVNTTVATNTARFAGGVGIGFYDYNGFLFSPNRRTVGKARFINSLIGANSSTDMTVRSDDCGVETGAEAAGGGVIENVASLLQGDAPQAPDDNRCSATFPFAVIGDPLLSPLRANGGRSFTHLPLVGSPAINAGSAAAVPGDLVATTDQRGPGFLRVLLGLIDIGAVEANDAALPIANNDQIAMLQGGTAVSLVGGATSLKANDLDADDGVPGGAVELVAAPQRGQLTLAASGSFAYVHDGSAFRTDSFTYRVRDSAGNLSNTATVSIEIDLTLIFRNGFEASAP